MRNEDVGRILKTNVVRIVAASCSEFLIEFRVVPTW
jgi:hypothetical protein